MSRDSSRLKYCSSWTEKEQEHQMRLQVIVVMDLLNFARATVFLVRKIATVTIATTVATAKEAASITIVTILASGESISFD